MKRAVVLSIGVTVVMLAVAVKVEAQQAKKVHRVGFLSPIDSAGESARFEAIRLSLRELGLLTLFNKPVKKETQAHAQ